ncbi:MAG TPA: hypothetical protein VNX60_09285 [Candidatus Acidoferrum sp.]|nr:hypothetical protein [Candidatus Acidoferrum sp.]
MSDFTAPALFGQRGDGSKDLAAAKQFTSRALWKFQVSLRKNSSASQLRRGRQECNREA